MKKLVLLLVLLLNPIVLLSQTKYSTKMGNDELIIQKTYLTISYSKNNKIPYYVGYYVIPGNLVGEVQRESDFYTETSITKSYRSYSSNYTNSGYDRGHMSPAADWKCNKNAMHESFSMANICPQSRNLNRVYWNSIENIERKYALRCDTLFVISGEICSGNIVIKNNIGVPERFYKTCVGVKNKKVVLSIGWMFDNSNEKQPEGTHRTSIEKIEKMIKQDLYKGFWFNGTMEGKLLIF